jgi:hypothetical protein
VAVGDAGALFYSTNGANWIARGNNFKPYTSVAFGNGKFVTLAFDGSLQTSPDGNVWTPGSQPLPVGAYSFIRFINGKFAVFNGTSIAFSTDASTWSSPASLNAGNGLSRIAFDSKLAYSGGTYIFAGSAGIVYSTDGTSWTKAAKPTGSIQMVAAANGKFFAQDSGNQFWTSSNGIDWVHLTYMRADLFDVAFIRGHYISLGQDLYTSNDGIVWSNPETDTLRQTVHQRITLALKPTVTGHPITDQPFLGIGLPFAPERGPIGEAPVRFYFRASNLGSFWVGDHGYIYYHYNTLNTNYGVVPALTDSTLRTVAGTDYQYAAVIGGDHGILLHIEAASGRNPPAFELLPKVTSENLLSGAGNSESAIFVGTGGIILRTTDQYELHSWSVVPSGTTSTLRQVIYYSKDLQNSAAPVTTYIAVGDNGTILTSADGASWTLQDSGTTVNLIGSSMQSLASGRRFIAAGEDGTLLESTNAIDWHQVAPLPAPQKLVVLDNLEARGENGLSMTPAPFTSDSPNDGTFSMLYDVYGSGAVTGAALGNGRWVVVGGGSSGASLDGIHWSSKLVDATFEAVTFGNGKFVAVTGDGKIGVSNDGLNWTFDYNVPTKLFHAVGFGVGRFVALGGGGTILISNDGVTWTDKTLGSAGNLYAITYHEGTFVGVGANGSVVRSTDNGDTWTTSSSFTGDTYGVAYGNGRYVAAGADGKVAYSLDGKTWVNKVLPARSTSEPKPTFRRTIFANDTFYSTVRNGELYTTTNGVDWVALNTGTSQQFDGVVVGNGRILLAGTQIYSLTIPNAGSPSITQQPASTSAKTGEDAHFSVTVTGQQPVTYQWYYNGTALSDGDHYSGAATSQLNIHNVSLSDAGSYSAAVQNDAGTSLSATATLEISEGSTGQTFAEWLSDKGLNVGVNDGPEQDADGDGLSNIVEFALGSDPAAPSEKPKAQVVNSSGQDYAAIQFTRNKNSSGVEIQVSASDSVTADSNETVTESAEDLGNGTERVTVRATKPLNEIRQLYFNVRVAGQ